MAEPFSPEVATRLIREKPGSTAQELVEYALSHDVIRSRSSHFAIASQGGALVKMWQAGRLPQVRRDESQRPYRYYPKDHKGESTAPKVERTVLPDQATQGISFRPTSKQDRAINALVSVGVVATRTEAVQWLLEQGIAAKLDFVERALAIKAQAEELKKGMLALDE